MRRSSASASSGGTLFAGIANNDVVHYMKQKAINDNEPALFFNFLEWYCVEVYYSSTRLCLADAWPVRGRCLATVMFNVWPVSGLAFFENRRSVSRAGPFRRRM